MEEYEVDLRDYIRVLWRGKWIVLVVFVIALGVAAVVSFRAPDIYRAQALLLGEKPPILPIAYSPPAIDVMVEWAHDSAVLAQAVLLAGENLSPDWLAGHLQARKQGKFVELTLEGALKPDRLQDILAGVVEAFKAKGTKDVKLALEGALALVSARREKLARKQRALEEELAWVRAQAEAQREELLSQLSQLEADPALSELPLGERVTVEGYRIQKEMDLLYAQLQAVELELYQLDRFGVRALPGGAESYASLQGELAEVELEEEAIKEALSSPPSPVVVVRGAVATSAPIAPNRKMNLAVAGVLGLFVGVLLAFFAHYLGSEGEKRPPPPLGEGPDRS